MSTREWALCFSLWYDSAYMAGTEYPTDLCCHFLCSYLLSFGFFLSATALPLPCNYASGSSLLMSAIHLLPSIKLVQLRTAVVHSYYLCNYAFAAINRWQVVKCFEVYRQEWTYGHSGTSVAKQWTQFTQEGLISSLNNQYFSLKIKVFGLLRRV